jgi:hypothetical protein
MILSLILIFPAVGNSNLSYNLHVTSNADHTNTNLEICTFVLYCLLHISVTHLTGSRCRYCWLANVWQKYAVDNNRQRTQFKCCVMWSVLLATNTSYPMSLFWSTDPPQNRYCFHTELWVKKLLSGPTEFKIQKQFKWTTSVITIRESE